MRTRSARRSPLPSGRSSTGSWEGLGLVSVKSAARTRERVRKRQWRPGKSSSPMASIPAARGAEARMPAWTGTSPSGSTPSCRRRSARAAATTGAARTPTRSRRARRTSIAVRRAERRPSSRLPRSPAARPSRSPPTAGRSPATAPHASTSRTASAARCASTPARSMRSSAARSRCTSCSRTSAAAASSASRPARSTASRCTPPTAQWSVADAVAARSRHRARIERLDRGERIADRGATLPTLDAAATRAATVAAAMERARARRADAPPRAT